MRLGDLKSQLWRHRWPLGWLAAASAFAGLVWWLRRSSYVADPLLHGYLETIGVVLAFTYAANALVRYRGTHDRISLILAFGFVLAGLLEMAAGLSLAGAADSGRATLPAAWLVGRTVLAAVLLAALVVERRLPNAREPVREIAAALLVVGGVAYLATMLFLGLSREATVPPGALLPRPWNLAPAALFAAAAYGYWRRLDPDGIGARPGASSFDRVICPAAIANVLCHLLASQSVSPYDAPFAFAQVLKVGSYALVLGGALLDNARLFDQVRQMAASDPLTGLANYRRFIDVLESEVRRSERTQRTFAMLLLDLDGLKRINDRHGHLVGTRAISRMADVLRGQCRSIDTAARYGGDEFALVLPESGAAAAWQVARRICERLEHDGEQPQLAVSLGVAVYPQDGQRIEALLAVADRVLYKMKGRRDKTAVIRKMAASL